MRKTAGLALALMLAAGVPTTVMAQIGGGKPAPQARPAPAARPAPHPAPAARPAPMARPAPAFRAAPHPVVRAAPRPAPHAAPRPVVRAAPHPTPRHVARPELRRAPATARTIHREQRRVERQQRQAPRIATTPQNRAATRAAARQERALRQQEDRSLRRLPPSQRAARREEIRHAREQRAQQRRQATSPAVQTQPNAQIQRNAQRNAQRRNGQPRIGVQAARQGRFAAAFAQPAVTTQQRQARHNRWSARQAWRHHVRAPFIAWYGPVFWPYAYSDVFDYAFWPDGYDDGYWAYAYDDFVDGLFWGEEGPPAEYAYAPDSSGRVVRGPAPAPVRYAAVQELCRQPGSGITAWPIAEIEKKVGLNDEQKQLLADMKAAAQQAASAFKASCPAENAFPLTPPGRLTAMTARLGATLDAVNTVKPALDKFYNSLSDEQKERFNEIGPQPKGGAETTAQASAGNADSCKQPKPGLANLPIEKIEDVVKPTDAQADALNALQEATDKAVGILQAACPDETPLTPPGRLDAMATRLKAMIDATNTVKPALVTFYDQLSSEQKARFNRMGRTLAAND